MDAETQEDQKIKKLMAQAVTKFGTVLSTLNQLLQHIGLGDSCIITVLILMLLAYSVLVPLFTPNSSTAQSLGIPCLVDDCLGILKSLFSQYPIHRHFITEEVITRMCPLVNSKTCPVYSVSGGISLPTHVVFILYCFHETVADKQYHQAMQEIHHAVTLQEPVEDKLKTVSFFNLAHRNQPS